MLSGRLGSTFVMGFPFHCHFHILSQWLTMLTPLKGFLEEIEWPKVKASLVQELREDSSVLCYVCGAMAPFLHTWK